jgi:tryptophan 2,3-dioxygenase
MYGVSQIPSEVQAVATMTLQKFRKELFMNGALASLQFRQLRFVVINQHNFMAKFRKTGSGYESNVS